MDHPFLIKFVRSFKDARRLYLLLEYANGLDLAVIMRHIGIFTNNDSVFYAASILLVFDYLHDREILYRDLKPENIIVEGEGFIKLIDLGSAKSLQGRTYTLIGTPFYMAPEVIVGRGYGKSADLWSLGVIIFEFLCGKVPFGHCENSPYRVYEEILSKDLEFPKGIPQLTENAISLVKRLLNKFSDTRIYETTQKIMTHDWFGSVDWEDLYCKNTVPPYKPTIKIDDLEDLEDFANGDDVAWDYSIWNDSNESNDAITELDDQEIQAYKLTIPHNWDQQFA